MGLSDTAFLGKRTRTSFFQKRRIEKGVISEEFLLKQRELIQGTVAQRKLTSSSEPDLFDLSPSS